MQILKNKNGSGSFEMGIKILIVVILGGLVLTVFSLLINQVVVPNLQSRVTSVYEIET